MKIKQTIFVGALAAVIGVIALCSAQPASAATKPLDRVAAKRILESFGYQNVVIGAIVAEFGNMGAMPISSPNVAYVLGVGQLGDSNSAKIEKTFFFDEEQGWFLYEFQYLESNNQQHFKQWNVNGFKVSTYSTK